MAKRPNRALKQIIEGVSDQTVVEANRVYEKSKDTTGAWQNCIKLPLGERQVTYELVTIAPDEIERRTRVLDTNARQQAYLNPESLRDLLVTFNVVGQQFPAIGQQTDDGIVVMDGSRRRAACILSQQPYLIYVTREDINPEEAMQQSNVGNAHKPLSLFEQGQQWASWIAAGRFADVKTLARVCQLSESLVYDAINATDLPAALLKTFPAPMDLGRPTFNYLRKMQQRHGADKLIALSSDIKQQLSGSNSTEKNKQHVVALKQALAARIMSEPVKTLHGHNQAQATIKNTEKGIQVTFKKLSTKQQAQFEQWVLDLINDKQLTV